jgi:hypothetical protein
MIFFNSNYQNITSLVKLKGFWGFGEQYVTEPSTSKILRIAKDQKLKIKKIDLKSEIRDHKS